MLISANQGQLWVLVTWKWIGNISFDVRTIKMMSGPNLKSNGEWDLFFIN